MGIAITNFAVRAVTGMRVQSASLHDHRKQQLQSCLRRGLTYVMTGLFGSSQAWLKIAKSYLFSLAIHARVVCLTQDIDCCIMQIRIKTIWHYKRHIFYKRRGSAVFGRYDVQSKALDSLGILTTGTSRPASLVTDPGPTPTPGSTTTITFPTAPTRTTTPVPVRSKQRSSSLVDPQPKKKQKGESIPEPRLAHNLDAVHSTSLPIISDARSADMNSDDSDGEAASREDISYIHGGKARPRTPPLTLTPNPKAPPSPQMHITHAIPANNTPPDPARPWTHADDQELIGMKQDTKSRPSWKTIGARLHRDPQLCKLRWGLLKQTSEVNDPPGPGNPPHELEGDD